MSPTSSNKENVNKASIAINKGAMNILSPS